VRYLRPGVRCRLVSNTVSRSRKLPGNPSGIQTVPFNHHLRGQTNKHAIDIIGHCYCVTSFPPVLVPPAGVVLVIPEDTCRTTEYRR
jgi:hypothetical protein